MSLELDRDKASKRAIKRDYAFILRCWPEPDDSSGDAAVWRFSLNQIYPQKRINGFANLDAIMAYLDQFLTNENG